MKIVKTFHKIDQLVELPVKGWSTEELKVPKTWQFLHMEADAERDQVICYWLTPHVRWMMAEPEGDDLGGVAQYVPAR